MVDDICDYGNTFIISLDRGLFILLGHRMNIEIRLMLSAERHHQVRREVSAVKKMLSQTHSRFEDVKDEEHLLHATWALYIQYLKYRDIFTCIYVEY